MAKPFLAVKLSSPPFILTTRFSLVPMSIEKGAGVGAVEADARAIGSNGEFFGAIAAVDFHGVDAVAAFVESLPSPGFQIMRSLPDSPKTWSVPTPPVRVSLPAPPNSRSSPPFPRSYRCRPHRRACRCRSRRSGCRCRRRRRGVPTAVRRWLRRA